MKCGRWIVVLAALGLVGLSSTETRGEPKKSAEAAPIKAVDLELLVEVARARTLPAGLDESSPQLAKIVSLVEAGKTQAALPLVAKYAKANKAQLDDDATKLVASWIVRRALLLPHKDMYSAADRLRYAKDGKLALAKYEASLSGKTGKDLAPAFALTPYTDGAEAVTVLTKKKKVSVIKKDLETALKDILAKDTFESSAILNPPLAEIQAWMTLLKSVADSKGEVQKQLARYN